MQNSGWIIEVKDNQSSKAQAKLVKKDFEATRIELLKLKATYEELEPARFSLTANSPYNEFDSSSREQVSLQLLKDVNISNLLKYLEDINPLLLSKELPLITLEIDSNIEKLKILLEEISNYVVMN